MVLIDTHCHLYSEEFAGDIDLVVENAVSEGVKKFYLPSLDSKTVNAMIELEERFPGKCFAMMGLHPCYVKENYRDELENVLYWLKKRKFPAVGEIGLDFYWDRSFVAEQEEAFRMQIEWAIELNLPLVIHTRDAMQETINIVKEYTFRDVPGIFHCFSGSYENAVEITEAGFYLGIGGVITYKNSGLAGILKNIDLKYLVIETDAPYLSPAPFRGKRNESGYLKYILKKLAEVKNVTIEEAASFTTANAEKIFGD